MEKTNPPSYGAVEDQSDAKGNKLRYIDVFKKKLESPLIEELKHVLLLTLPTILTYALRFTIPVETIIMNGHKSKYEMDAVGLANSLSNVCGLCISTGFACACDTLFSQSYGGERKDRVGMYLQRALLVMIPIYILSTSFLLNIEPFLLLVKQDVILSRMAAHYIIYLLPGIYLDFVFLIFVRYLQNQNIKYPPVFATIIGNIFNAVTQYFCLYVFNLSFLISGACQSMSYGVMLIFLIIYILVSKVYKKTFTGFHVTKALQGWGQFAVLAFYAIIMVSLEEWAFEILSLVAGGLGPNQLGAENNLFIIQTLSFMIPLSVGIAVSVRVGQHLGAQEPEKAQKTHHAGILLVLFTSSIMCVIYLTTRNILPFVFTDNNGITSIVMQVIPIFIITDYLTAISVVSSGTLRGCGRQLTGAVLVVINFYGIALPIGICLGVLTYLEVLGLWIGMVIGLFCQTVWILIVLRRIDWQYESARAQTISLGTKAVRKMSLADEDIPLEVIEPSSSGITIDDDKPLIDEEAKVLVKRKELRTELIVKRSVTLIAFLLLLLAAILMRTYPPHFFPRSKVTHSNITRAINS